ncbi:MAG: hypothetical protein JSW52_09215 [Candidatus Coatesbacteria bacterium]|nr:MAG: hypothetical protein JSW52_09215 [Candidatus Coatesbacteria bacterium]
MKSLIPAVLGVILLTPAAGFAGGTEDVIFLKDGSVYRGIIVDEVPGETYKIEIAGGSVFVFEAAEVDYISRGLEKEGKAPSRPGQETPPETSRLSFGFRAVVGSTYINEEALIPFGGLLLFGLRAHAVYTPSLAVGYVRTEPKDGDHRSVLAHSFIPIHIQNRFTFYRGGSMKMHSEFDVGYGLVYGGSKPGQKGGFLYGFGQAMELGPGKIRVNLSATLYVQHYDTYYWGAEPMLMFLGGVGFSV